MNVFSDKLDRLCSTIEFGASDPGNSVADALAAGRDFHALAIGSGGSAVAAQYLATCRDTLGCPSTSVQTPMRFVLGTEPLGERQQVWLFSARGENADASATLAAALERGARSIHVVTCNPASRLVAEAATSRIATVHVTPVADQKDGFLATHSLIAAVNSLLLASDRCAVRPVGKDLASAFLDKARACLGADRRAEARVSMSSFAATDTLILLTDPRLMAASTLIETSLWEAAIGPVQVTDFRNFAHGRHVWLARRAHDAFVLSITTPETTEAWREIEAHIPSEVRRVTVERSGSDRFESALAIVNGLSIVEALGAATGIDPGRPGHGPFAKPIYEGVALRRFSERLTSPIRRKWAAIQDGSRPRGSAEDAASAGVAFRARLSEVRFGGLILDYDGTIVTTAGRFEPPSPEIVAELVRLLKEGISLGIATGRGGSAGEMLRAVLPSELHRRVHVGYYNGGFVRTLDVDIREHAPELLPDIAEAVSWLEHRAETSGSIVYRNSGVQITINAADLVEPDAFVQELEAALAGSYGRLKVARSQHSIDVVPINTTKGSVVLHLESLVGGQGTLCVGDSGQWGGNDYDLLGGRFGISVDRVCDRIDAGWPLFGPVTRGPDALIRILRSLSRDPDGGHRLATEALDGTP